MYYNSKSEFYFKQYVLPITTIAISVSLILVGVYVYWASNSENALKQNLVATQNESVTNNNTTETNNEEKQVNELYDLPALEKSNIGKITNVCDNGNVIFNYNDKDYELTLIGIDTQHEKDLLNVLKNDLLNKDVKVSFDVNKSNGENVFAYVYLNDKLYNENIIERGITSYKKEDINTTYNSNLIQAQAYAKQLDSGIWAE